MNILYFLICSVKSNRIYRIKKEMIRIRES